jgi:hypothetical protein
MLLRVTYYEQQDLFDHEGADFRRWTDNLHCRRKKNKIVNGREGQTKRG